MSEQETDIETYEVAIEGISPIKMHKFNGKEKLSETIPDEDVAEKSVYRLQNGNLAVPCEWIYGTLMNSARMIAPKMQKKSYENYITRRVRVTPNLIDLGTKSYEIDRRFVKNYGRGGTSAEIAIKPRIDVWKINFYIKTSLDEKELKNLLENAGVEVGIGNDIKHGYGQFKVTSVKTM